MVEVEMEVEEVVGLLLAGAETDSAGDEPAASAAPEWKTEYRQNQSVEFYP